MHRSYSSLKQYSNIRKFPLCFVPLLWTSVWTPCHGGPGLAALENTLVLGIVNYEADFAQRGGS